MLDYVKKTVIVHVAALNHFHFLNAKISIIFSMFADSFIPDNGHFSTKQLVRSNINCNINNEVKQQYIKEISCLSIYLLMLLVCHIMCYF